MRKSLFLVFIVLLIGSCLFASEVTKGIPVWISLKTGSEVPSGVFVEDFTINIKAVSATKLDGTTVISTIPMPSVSSEIISCPTATGLSNRTGWGEDDINNPFTITFLQDGIYTYQLTASSCEYSSYTIDTTRWNVYVKISNGSAVLSYGMKDMVGDYSADGFNYTKGTSNGGSISSEGSATILTIGGTSENKTNNQFDSAAVKSKFAVDFTRSFKASGWIYSTTNPDGSCIGFVPSNATLTADDIKGVYYNGTYNTTKNGKGIFLEFDTWGNKSTDGANNFNIGDQSAQSNITYGQDGRHMCILTTNASGWINAGSVKFSDTNDAYNIAKDLWPYDYDHKFTYEITFDKDTKKLVYTFTDSVNNKTYTFTYTDPVSHLGQNTAYFLLSGNVRQGPVGQYGVTGAGQTKICFQSFDYLDRGTEENCDDLFIMAYKRVHKVLMYVGATNSNNSSSDTSDANSLRPAMHALENLYISDGYPVAYTSDLKSLESNKLISQYSLIYVAFPDDEINTNISEYATNLRKFSDQGGCLVFVGETNNNQDTWAKGNENLTSLSKQMGLSIEYAPQDRDCNTSIAFTIKDSNHALTKNVAGLSGFVVPSLIVGQGSNTQNNTTVIATMSFTNSSSQQVTENVIVDCKVGSGYVTYLTDINMWMGSVWNSSDTSTMFDGKIDTKSKQFMRNIISRSITNISEVALMSNIYYKEMDNAYYPSDSDGSEYSNPAKYDSSTETFTILNPYKPKYGFDGWTGTGISGSSKSVTVVKGSSGDRTYTATWHEHDWTWKASGFVISGLCSNEGCEYHTEPLELIIVTNGANLAPVILPENSTNKNLKWKSSDSEVVSAYSYGTVIGHKEGENIVITGSATDGSGKTSSMLVSVVDFGN